MKNLLLISMILIFVGCGDLTETVGIQVQKRTVTFPNGTSAGYSDWEIVTCSDGHDYLENSAGSGYAIMHYVECVKCKNK